MRDFLIWLQNPKVELVLCVVVFFVGYLYVCVASKHRAAFLWLCVCVLLALGVFAPTDEKALLPSIVHLGRNLNWNVLMILAGAMLVAEMFTLSKVPMLLADLIVRHLRTVGGAAIGACALAGFLSAFIDNVTTTLMLAPVAMELARRLRVSPVPFVIGIAISANVQGMATMIGDPPSLILANGLQMNFLDFFIFRGRPSVFWAVQVGALGSLVVLWVFFFRKHREPAAELEMTRPTSWFPTWLLVAMVAALCVASQVSRSIPGADKFLNGAVCIVAAGVGLIWHLQHGFKKTVEVALRLDVETVALLAAVFALTFALDKTGFVDQIARWIGRATGDDKFLAFNVIVWSSVAFSAAVDNIPYTTVMVPTVLRVASRMTGSSEIGPTHILLAFGLLVGACLGGNISPVGASANIAGIGLLRKNGHHVGFWQFVRMGLPFTIGATIPASLFVWWIWS